MGGADAEAVGVSAYDLGTAVALALIWTGIAGLVALIAVAVWRDEHPH